MQNWFERLVEPIFRRTKLAVRESESSFLVGARGLSGGERDQPAYTREEILAETLLAWRTDPLARRIVALTTDYVVGGGLRLRCAHPRAEAFLREWWDHPLNRIPLRAAEWCDELSRSGDLFFLLSSGADGMSYVRALAAANVGEVRTRANDVQQELAIVERADADGVEREWPVYDPWEDQMQSSAPGADGNFATSVLHYAVNRPVGAVWGESDLAPLLRWLKRYAGWLEDRARLNRYRNTFLFHVKAAFLNEEERLGRQQALTANFPSSGSILVTDESESWEVIAPRLESQAAGEDGLALKRMIAAGAGVPLHFLAEPEGATRTTAEAAGGPAYRRFELRQAYFCWMLEDLARAALRRRRLALGEQAAGWDASQEQVQVLGTDLSARDNAAVADAAGAVSEALARLWDRGLIPEEELRRLVYRFLGETGEESAPLRHPCGTPSGGRGDNL